MDRSPTGPPFPEGQGASLQLAQRLALVSPQDTTRGFLFSTALELVRTQEGERAWRRCTEAAGSSDFKSFFNYPISSFLRLAYAACDVLGAHYGGFDEAMQNLGFRVMPRFLDSAAGKLMLSLVTRDAQRLVEALPAIYRTSWDHGQCWVTWLGPQHARLDYINAVPVAYFTGSVLQVLATAHLNGQAHGHQKSLSECSVELSWK